MDCSCSASPGYEGENTYWVQRDIKKARKKYKCYECGGLIQKGFPYHRHICFCDGSCSHYKYCVDCQNVVDTFFLDGWVFGQVWGHLRNYLDGYWGGDLPTSCIVELKPKARDKVCDILQEAQQDD